MFCEQVAYLFRHFVGNFHLAETHDIGHHPDLGVWICGKLDGWLAGRGKRECVPTALGAMGIAGSSSGASCFADNEIAKELGPKKNVVVVLPCRRALHEA